MKNTNEAIQLTVETDASPVVGNSPSKEASGSVSSPEPSSPQRLTWMACVYRLDGSLC